jgi:2-polyprenyl-3-methyl-5-hydroxy-6-metoxy-1,4-benzoquinol methylase/16S rRNA G966 N2-methylase RsmD
MADFETKLRSYFGRGVQPREGRNYARDKLAYMKPYYKADRMAQWMEDKGIRHVVEACGGLGGNTCAFAAHSKKIASVLTYEYDRDNFQMIDANLNLYDLRRRVLLLNQPFRWDIDDLLMSTLASSEGKETLLSLEQGILSNTAVYIDPPWLSQDFKGKTKEEVHKAYLLSDITLSGKTLETWAQELPVRMVVFHLPPGYKFKLPGVTIDDTTDDKARLVYYFRENAKPPIPAIIAYLAPGFFQRPYDERVKPSPVIRVNPSRGLILTDIRFLLRHLLQDKERGKLHVGLDSSLNNKNQLPRILLLADLFPNIRFYMWVPPARKPDNIYDLGAYGLSKDANTLWITDQDVHISNFTPRAVLSLTSGQTPTVHKGPMWFIPYFPFDSTATRLEYIRKNDNYEVVPNDPELIKRQMFYYNTVYRPQSFEAAHSRYGQYLDTILEYDILRKYVTQMKSKYSVEDLSKMLDRLGKIDGLVPGSSGDMDAMFYRMLKKIYRDKHEPIKEKPKTLADAQAILGTLPPLEDFINIKPRSSDYLKADMIKDVVHSKDEVILDYGCGDALMLNLVENKSYGIDRQELQERHNYLRSQGVKFNARLLYANDLRSLETVLDENKVQYNVLTFFHVIHHIENPREVISALVSRLPIGGKVIIYDHNAVTQEQIDALTIQHDFYRHAYKEQYYYTDFMSWNMLKNLLPASLRLISYRELPTSPDYSYVAVFGKVETGGIEVKK